MEIKLSLTLPRDELSVPVSRQVLRSAMRSLGVDEVVLGDIEVAMTEACTNVLDHARADESYEISATITGTKCTIEVVNRGEGFDSSGLGHSEAPMGAEEGRGIQLMRALVDNVTFVNAPTEGTVVHLEKILAWRDDSLMSRLTREEEHRKEQEAHG